MADFDWQPIDTAPRDGTRILARSKNGGGFWTEPCVVWWAENAGWDCDPDEDGHPMIIYHPLIEWVPIARQSGDYHLWDKSEIFKA